MTDIHIYDGKLDRQHTHAQVAKFQKLSAQGRDNHLKAALARWCPALADPREAALLARIATDQGKGANYDNTNDLWAEDLLLLLHYSVPRSADPEFVPLLSTHLHDMLTGSCPQGRVIRLWQLALPFI